MTFSFRGQPSTVFFWFKLPHAQGDLVSVEFLHILSVMRLSTTFQDEMHHYVFQVHDESIELRVQSNPFN